MSKRITRSRRPRDDGDIQAHATVLQVVRSESTSRQLDFQDEWSGHLAGADLIIPPPYSVGHLFQVIEQSSILRPCIEAYTVNTVGTGWEVGESVKGVKAKKSETRELADFIEHCNSEEGLSTVMSKVIDDRESVGFGFLEGIRDASGTLSLIRHAPALYTRLGHKHPQEVLVEYPVHRGSRTFYVKEFKKFRRFVQLVGGKIVWFKEWGDPRQMDRKTGAFKGEAHYTAGRDATEILHFKLPSNEPYGVPRWITQLPSVLGSREAEEVNMQYFKDNTVPPMMLMVSGGRLTKSSFNNLNEMLNHESIGRERQSRIMLIEAVGDSDTLDSKGTPVKLDVEKLSDVRQSDSLFSNYDKANRSKARQAWRLPGILLGEAEDSSNANAQVSVFLADSQVFDPGRFEVDEILNNRLVRPENGLGLKSVKLVSRVPPISSPETVIKTLTALNVMGAVTPRSAQAVANTVMQMELPGYPEKGQEGYEEWMDKPLTLTKGSKTHDEQEAKSQEIKDLEEDGDVGFRRPENGSEAEEIPDV